MFTPLVKQCDHFIDHPQINTVTTLFQIVFLKFSDYDYNVFHLALNTHH